MPTPDVAERLTVALVPRLQAALTTQPVAADVRVYHDGQRFPTDPPLTVTVTPRPPRYEPATGEDDFAHFGFHPVVLVVTYQPPVPEPDPPPFGYPAYLGGVRTACLNALLDPQPLLAAVPEIDGATHAPELEAGWRLPNRGSSQNTVNAAATFRTREPR